MGNNCLSKSEVTVPFVPIRKLEPAQRDQSSPQLLSNSPPHSLTESMPLPSEGNTTRHPVLDSLRQVCQVPNKHYTETAIKDEIRREEQRHCARIEQLQRKRRDSAADIKGQRGKLRRLPTRISQGKEEIPRKRKDL